MWGQKTNRVGEEIYEESDEHLFQCPYYLLYIARLLLE